MPAGQRPFAIAFHRVRRHGHDRRVQPREAFALTNLGCSLKTVHLRHLDVHQHQRVRDTRQRIERLAAVADHVHAATDPLEHRRATI